MSDSKTTPEHNQLHYKVAANAAHYDGLPLWHQALAQHLSQTEFAKAWAQYLGVALIDPTHIENWPEHPHTENEIESALRSGILRVEADGAPLRMLISADMPTLSSLKDTIATQPELKERLFLCTPHNFVTFIYERYGHALIAHTSAHLSENLPHYSAHSASKYGLMMGGAVALSCLGIVVFALTAWPALTLIAVALSLLFICGTLIRLQAILGMATSTAISPVSVPTAQLPMYSILVPLYEESTVIPQLLAALNALDYPAEKLDIKLILEARDTLTAQALAEFALPPHYEVLTLADVGPRTKPKALMAAMPRVKGEMITIYDAEDIPHPQQLRDAVAHMAHFGPNCACLQAVLQVQPMARALLGNHFALEYATWFNVLLPGFARAGYPLPLGGTSNHFRTAALLHAGGWDPYNVTEDADLGLRLARFGYTVQTFPSPTQEEAPPHLAAWMNQRTRWMKGWLQTLAVHLWQAKSLSRQAGIKGFAAVVLIPGGSVLGAMLFPLSVALVCVQLWLAPDTSRLTPWEHNAKIFMQFSFWFGLIVPLLANIYTAFKLNTTRWLWLVPMIPAYWLLTSYAAWRAVWELWRRPFHWHKTPHTGIKKHLK